MSDPVLLALLIRELSLSDPATLDSLGMDETKIKREVQNFFALLFERLLDLNSYVRSKVASLLIKTCEYVFQFLISRL